MEDLSVIRERIKKRREELGYSYQNLADLTGLSKSTLQRYETGGIGNLPLDKLEILAKALRFSPAYLMGWVDDGFSLVAHLIKDARERAGMSIEDLSLESGYPVSLLEEYESGCKKPNIEELGKIANALGVSVYSLTDFDLATNIAALRINNDLHEYGDEYNQYARMVQAFSYLNHLGAEKAASAVEDLAKIQEYRREEDKF